MPRYSNSHPCGFVSLRNQRMLVLMILLTAVLVAAGLGIPSDSGRFVRRTSTQSKITARIRRRDLIAGMVPALNLKNMRGKLE
jgi:hypothetical protein